MKGFRSNRFGIRSLLLGPRLKALSSHFRADSPHFNRRYFHLQVQPLFPEARTFMPSSGLDLAIVTLGLPKWIGLKGDWHSLLTLFTGLRRCFPNRVPCQCRQHPLPHFLLLHLSMSMCSSKSSQRCLPSIQPLPPGSMTLLSAHVCCGQM